MYVSSTPRLTPVSRAIRSTLLSLPVLAVMVLPYQSLHAATPEQAQAATVDVRTYAINPGSLASVITRFANEAGVQLSVEGSLTAGLQSPGVKGAYSVSTGFAMLLNGTGLEVAHLGNGFYTLRKAPLPSSEGLTVLPTITAQAVRDAASEGSGSYGVSAVSIGKSVQTLREIPQSISVVTRQRMDEQNLTTVEDALKTATGVTAVSQGEGTAIFYSRGFTMNSQYDGVPAGRQIINGYKQLDTAVYDRVEVLRGPAGLLQGSGEPGGSVNLVRKGPLDQFMISGSLSTGSWNNHRGELDVTGPLNATGTVRGRAVLAIEDRDFHYDTAHNRQQVLYGTLDWDITANTMLSLTATRQHSTLTGRVNSLPTYTDGSFLNVPRNTSVGADWQRWEYPINEYAAELSHRFDNDWKAKVSVRRRTTNFDTSILVVSSAVDPLTNTVDYRGRKTNWPVKNQDIDINLGGPFELLGRRHEFLIGYNNSLLDMNGGYQWTYFNNRNLFNPGIDESSLAPSKPNFVEQETQSGFYSMARLKIADPVTLIIGGRLSKFQIKSRSADDDIWSDFSKTQNRFTPYGGLVWDLNTQLTAYVSYTNIFVPQGEKDVSGQRIDPREGWQAEAGLKAALMDNKLNASVAVFRVRDKNRSVLDPNPAHVCDTWNGACAIAAGQAQSQGWEAEVSGKITPNWNVTAGYTYNTTKLLNDGGSVNEGQPLLTFIPKHLFKLWTNYRFTPNDFGGALSGWNLGGGLTAQSNTYNGSSPAIIHQAGYATLGMQVGYRISKNVDVSLTINNLLDRKYYETIGGTDIGNYYGAPRNAMLTLRGAF